MLSYLPNLSSLAIGSVSAFPIVLVGGSIPPRPASALTRAPYRHPDTISTPPDLKEITIHVAFVQGGEYYVVL
ncbi:hypothetical protein GGR56DRAFT_516787 [Xylariaceae sp. FL0804]|nr:hypothetical protein GGR56DRAFT_516787 [Xylariaceae sp. FL0804]